MCEVRLFRWGHALTLSGTVWREVCWACIAGVAQGQHTMIMRPHLPGCQFLVQACDLSCTFCLLLPSEDSWTPR